MREPRFMLAYHPAGGLLTDAQVIERAQDYLADLEEFEKEDFKVVCSKHLPADDRIYVFDVKLITDLTT